MRLSACVSILVVAVATCAFATSMDQKGRVVATVATRNAGVAEVTCNEPGPWKFDVTASQNAGRDVVKVRISAPNVSPPPRFGVFFRVSGAGVQNVWTSDYERDGNHLRPQLWWGWVAKYKSQLARDMPIAVGFNSQGRSPVALACSEAFNALEFGLYADDRTCEMVGRCEFFTAPVAPLREYEVSVMLDRRGKDFAETVRQCTSWICERNGFRAANVPESAFDPLYSTWYAYLQDVHAGELEEEARLAAALGMKTMILDDGWQKMDSATFYSATGDWMPVPSRFPDMKAHVDAVHKAGLKYMLWLAVPYIGDEAKVWSRFKDKTLSVCGKKSPGRTAVLDPRFPEVREYLISTYERVVGEWGFDGVKLDFIDQFVQPSQDPAVKDGFAGRDYRSVPEAVDRLMKDVLARLRAIKPDVLVEFRQHYIGPAILQYGNMMRAADCPADPCANRKRMCDLRLTSGGMAVHSDMLVWSRDETPEGAALPILNVLYSTIQYSMILKTLKPEHRDVIRHWLAFSQKHRAALLKGAFTPHHAENGYTCIEGESADERVVTAYADDVCVRTGEPDRTVFLVNATGGRGMLVSFAADAHVELFDVYGNTAGSVSVAKGILRLDVPASGFAKVVWRRTRGRSLDPFGMILPRPQVVEPGAGTVSGEALARVTAARGPVRGAPAAVACEAYALEIRPEGVWITAPDARGERYARVTLAQLAKLCPGDVPVCKIRDWPVLRWRGYMNDCGRNYLDMGGLKAILDVMAAYKLNLFHWHLTDYHGWRLESKKHPSLQDPKAFRRQIGRYYTQDEFREIVDYAAARGITVMPELDVPGHTLALRKGLGVETMAAPGVEKAVTELFEELCSLAPADVMPFVHLGTDEARTREEKCDDAYVTTWAKAVNACGRKAVVWAPGKRIDPSCDVIDMAWYDNHVTNSANPFLYADYVRFYNGSWGPFDVLSHVAFADPRHWKSETGRQIGAVGCTWHDDNVGEDTCQLFRDCMVFPSLLGFADNYWSGRSEDHPEFISRLPRPGERLFEEAQELENRLATHRDVFFADFPFPFPFVRQTALRWRITDMTTGQVLARDVPQGTIWVKNRRNAKISFSQAKSGAVSLEMWIGSPSNRTTGAWIDCAGYYGAYSRLGGRTPHKGEWNRDGAKVFVNGLEIPPPDWKQPGMVSTTPAEREQDIPYSTDLLEKPLIDELPTLRAPTKLSLKKGWNYVRIVLPKSGRWCCTFCPVDGTSEHPREVEDLQYASDPP